MVPPCLDIDLHLLLNMLKSSPGLKSSETWLPLCLPKFNSNGFVYALIDYVRENIGLVFVSADREGFADLHTWKESVVKVRVIALLDCTVHARNAEA
jgi:hypothetical protein